MSGPQVWKKFRCFSWTLVLSEYSDPIPYYLCKVKWIPLTILLYYFLSACNQMSSPQNLYLTPISQHHPMSCWKEWTAAFPTAKCHYWDS